MQTVILAAGRGTRMEPLTTNRPKPMLPVGSAPLSEHVVQRAVDAGASELVIVVGYGATDVRDHFGRSFDGVPITYATQDDPKGTADALSSASHHLEGPFAVLNGDNLYDADRLSELMTRDVGIGGYRVDDPSAYGVLVTDGDEVDGIVEKPADPPSDLVNAGAYVFPDDVLTHLDVAKSERGEYELTDAVNRIATETSVPVVEFDRWADVGRPWELLDATEALLAESERRIDGDVHPQAEVRGNVIVEAGAKIDRGVCIEGPVYVGSGATVGPNAYVRGATALGEDVHVGNAVEIKNSILMARTAVPHLSYVGDSILGRDVNFGAGTTVANLRHDGADVELTVRDDRVSTGRRKFGVVVGDHVRTGINTSLNPGVRLSAGSTTVAGETVTRDR